MWFVSYFKIGGGYSSWLEVRIFSWISFLSQATILIRFKKIHSLKCRGSLQMAIWYHCFFHFSSGLMKSVPPLILHLKLQMKWRRRFRSGMPEKWGFVLGTGLFGRQVPTIGTVSILIQKRPSIFSNCISVHFSRKILFAFHASLWLLWFFC